MVEPRFPARFWPGDGEDDGWWLVDVPYFGAGTKGEDLEDARWMASDLVQMFLADWRGQGLEVTDVSTELPEGEGWEWVRPRRPGEWGTLPSGDFRE